MGLGAENEFLLEEALEKYIKSHTRGFVTVDGVITVINADYTCDVTVGTTIFNSVPVKVLTNSQASIYSIPVLNSKCLMSFRDGTVKRPQIIEIDQVDQLLINCKTLVQFNGGNLGGMVKVNDLVTRLNNVENDINNLKAAFTSWVVTPQDGGAALKVAAAAWSGAELSPTEKSDIENTQIQQ